MRRLERRPAQQRRVRRQQPGHRVHRGDLQRLLVVERRQHAGQPLGQHRLAGPGRAGEQQVVPAGGGHLDRAPAHRLPDHVAQVRPRPLRPRPDRRQRDRPAPPSPRRNASRSARSAAPRTSRPGTSAASARFSAGTTTRRSPVRAAAITAGQHAAGRPQPAVEPQLAEQHHLAEVVGRHRAGRRQHADRQRDVEHGPRFGSVAGSSASVIRRVGQVSPELTIAARIRSRDSCSAASGRPIIVTPGRPSARSAWISTSWPSTPSTATDIVRASVIRTRPSGAVRPGRRRCAAARSPRRSAAPASRGRARPANAGRAGAAGPTSPP